jgi:hypothetical protein
LLFIRVEYVWDKRCLFSFNLPMGLYGRGGGFGGPTSVKVDSSSRKLFGVVTYLEGTLMGQRSESANPLVKLRLIEFQMIGLKVIQSG